MHILIFIFFAVLCVVFPYSLPASNESKTQCDLNLWFGNQTIAWCSSGPPNITIQAVNYTGGCNTFVEEGSGGIRLWVDVEKGRVQELVGFGTNNCSLDSPVLFLAEPFLKLEHCGMLCMFVMLYPIASMRVNCTTSSF